MVDVFGVPWSALVEYVSTLSVAVEERRRESMMGIGLGSDFLRGMVW